MAGNIPDPAKSLDWDRLRPLRRRTWFARPPEQVAQELLGMLLIRADSTSVCAASPSLPAYARSRGIAPDRFEFQMLYGIRRDLQASLTAQGYRVRVYLPFGTQWFPYFMRRLGERPSNVTFLLRSLRHERKGVGLSELLTEVLKRDIEINKALK